MRTLMFRFLFYVHAKFVTFFVNHFLEKLPRLKSGGWSIIEGEPHYYGTLHEVRLEIRVLYAGESRFTILLPGSYFKESRAVFATAVAAAIDGAGPLVSADSTPALTAFLEELKSWKTRLERARDLNQRWPTGPQQLLGHAEHLAEAVSYALQGARSLAEVPENFGALVRALEPKAEKAVLARYPDSIDIGAFPACRVSWIGSSPTIHLPEAACRARAWDAIEGWVYIRSVYFNGNDRIEELLEPAFAGVIRVGRKKIEVAISSINQRLFEDTCRDRINQDQFETFDFPSHAAIPVAHIKGKFRNPLVPTLPKLEYYKCYGKDASTGEDLRAYAGWHYNPEAEQFECVWYLSEETAGTENSSAGQTFFNFLRETEGGKT